MYTPTEASHVFTNGAKRLPLGALLPGELPVIRPAVMKLLHVLADKAAGPGGVGRASFVVGTL
jgi:hypothetical protein